MCKKESELSDDHKLIKQAWTFRMRVVKPLKNYTDKHNYVSAPDILDEASRS